LKVELQSQDAIESFRSLRAEVSLLRRFTCWGEIADFVRAETAPPSEKDEVLRALLTVHQARPCPIVTTALVAAFGPLLGSQCYQRRGLNSDSDELWQTILLNFLEVIVELCPEDRSRPILIAVINTTMYRVRSACRREWRRQSRSPNETVEELDERPSPELPDAMAWRKDALARLGRLRRLKHITKSDYDMLVAVRVEGLTIKQYATAAGITYPAAKQRFSRAATKYQSLRGDMKIPAKSMSPYTPPNGPF
jgi:DNA-directed RNA polymerase specialized sigma24 family protein